MQSDSSLMHCLLYINYIDKFKHNKFYVLHGHETFFWNLYKKKQSGEYSRPGGWNPSASWGPS